MRHRTQPSRRTTGTCLASFLLAGLFCAGAAVAEPATNPATGRSAVPATGEANPEAGAASSGPAQAADPGPPEPERKPLWEIGVVGGGGWLPDYPAAGQNHWNGIGLPYAVYRGDILRVGERGIVRGLFLDLRNLEFDLSADAAFPVDSSDNRAREGMPNLDTLFEIGPQLIYKFLPRGSGQELDLSVATRAVLSTDLIHWRYQGFVVNPALTYADERFQDGDLRLIASISPQFGYGGLNRYFYQVKPRYVRPGRPEYDADGGYIGTELTLGASWAPFERVRVFGGVVPGYYKGSVNEGSPLYRDDFTIAVGGGIRFILFESERRADR